jgi:hypothetical protein
MHIKILIIIPNTATSFAYFANILYSGLIILTTFSIAVLKDSDISGINSPILS